MGNIRKQLDQVAERRTVGCRGLQPAVLNSNKYTLTNYSVHLLYFKHMQICYIWFWSNPLDE
jgi:hypothetical protein